MNLFLLRIQIENNFFLWGGGGGWRGMGWDGLGWSNRIVFTMNPNLK